MHLICAIVCEVYEIILAKDASTDNANNFESTLLTTGSISSPAAGASVQLLNFAIPAGAWATFRAQLPVSPLSSTSASVSRVSSNGLKETGRDNVMLFSRYGLAPSNTTAGLRAGEYGMAVNSSFSLFQRTQGSPVSGSWSPSLNSQYFAIYSSLDVAGWTSSYPAFHFIVEPSFSDPTTADTPAWYFGLFNGDPFKDFFFDMNITLTPGAQN